MQGPTVFTYFTQYEIYRQNHSGEYIYQQNGSWVHRDRPPAEIPASDLHASPSVLLALTDTPEHRHEAVKRAYPLNWAEASPVVVAVP